MGREHWAPSLSAGTSHLPFVVEDRHARSTGGTRQQLSENPPLLLTNSVGSVWLLCACVRACWCVCALHSSLDIVEPSPTRFLTCSPRVLFPSAFLPCSLCSLGGEVPPTRSCFCSLLSGGTLGNPVGIGEGVEPSLRLLMVWIGEKWPKGVGWGASRPGRVDLLFFFHSLWD